MRAGRCSDWRNWSWAGRVRKRPWTEEAFLFRLLYSLFAEVTSRLARGAVIRWRVLCCLQSVCHPASFWRCPVRRWAIFGGWICPKYAALMRDLWMRWRRMVRGRRSVRFVELLVDKLCSRMLFWRDWWVRGWWANGGYRGRGWEMWADNCRDDVWRMVILWAGVILALSRWWWCEFILIWIYNSK